MTDPLTPEWRAWVDKAAAQVIREMNEPGAPQPSLTTAREKQVIAGLQLGLSLKVLAKNLRTSPPAIGRIRNSLIRRGLYAR